MKKNINYLSLFIIPLFVISCTKEVTNIELPEVKSKPVVFCFLSPNADGTTLTITKTSSLNGPSSISHYITDAKVQIWNNLDTFVVPYDTNKSVYFCDSTTLKIQKGTEYNLKVMIQDFEAITSRCIIPSCNMPPYSINITSPTQEGFDYELIVNNTQNINAYCILQFNVPWIYWGDTISNELDFINFQLKEGIERFTLNEHYIVPENFDFPINLIPNLLYTARLLICDQTTYNYLEYLHRIRNLNPNLNNIPDYSTYNISGGLGVFGGYITK